jgi:hypothetical protein
MKTKVICFLVISAIATLSFSFTSVKSVEKSEAKSTTQRSNSEPAGGFVSEDKF